MAEFIEEIDRLQEEATPSLTQLLKSAMSAVSGQIRVAIPGEVLRYDYKKQLVDARPLLKRRYLDGSVEDPPTIYNVPVAFPRAGDAFVALPLAKGHNVLLLFSDRSLEKWLSAERGTLVDPEDLRSHHISDAVAIPGCYPFSDPAPVANATDVIVRNGGAGGSRLEMRLKRNNHLQVLNAQEELMKVLSDLVQTIREAVIYTCNGPQKLHHTDFEANHDRLKSFLEK